jgi:hypothetical protein
MNLKPTSSRKNWKKTVDWTLMTRRRSWVNAPRKSFGSLISGRIRNYDWRTKLCGNTTAWPHRMRGRIRLSVRQVWVECGTRRIRRMTKCRCMGVKSPEQRERSVRHVRLGSHRSGGDVQERSPAMPCARGAGKSNGTLALADTDQIIANMG